MSSNTCASSVPAKCLSHNSSASGGACRVAALPQHPGTPSSPRPASATSKYVHHAPLIMTVA
eukprot:2294794-Pyramimonas_sp.AAC.1